MNPSNQNLFVSVIYFIEFFVYSMFARVKSELKTNVSFQSKYNDCVMLLLSHSVNHQRVSLSIRFPLTDCA